MLTALSLHDGANGREMPPRRRGHAQGVGLAWGWVGQQSTPGLPHQRTPPVPCQPRARLRALCCPGDALGHRDRHSGSVRLGRRWSCCQGPAFCFAERGGEGMGGMQKQAAAAWPGARHVAYLRPRGGGWGRTKYRVEASQSPQPLTRGHEAILTQGGACAALWMPRFMRREGALAGSTTGSPNHGAILKDRRRHATNDSPAPCQPTVSSRGCHKDAHPFFFYYGIHSLMFGGYPPTAIGYTPTAIGYPPTAIGYPPAAIIGRIGHSEFFFSFIMAPPGQLPPASSTGNPRRLRRSQRCSVGSHDRSHRVTQK